MVTTASKSKYILQFIFLILCFCLVCNVFFNCERLFAQELSQQTRGMHLMLLCLNVVPPSTTLD